MPEALVRSEGNMPEGEVSTDLAVIEPSTYALVRDAKHAERIKRKLTQKTPPQYARQRGDGHPYLPHQYYSRVLTEAFDGNWSLRVDDRTMLDGKGADKEVMVAVTLVTPGGSYPGYGQHTYQAGNPNQSYAWAIQSAMSKAFRAAAMRIGIGMDHALDELEDSTPGEKEAESAWKSALQQASVGEKSAITLLAEKLDAPFGTMDELLDAVAPDGNHIAGYWKLIELLKEVTNA